MLGEKILSVFKLSLMGTYGHEYCDFSFGFQGTSRILLPVRIRQSCPPREILIDEVFDPGYDLNRREYKLFGQSRGRFQPIVFILLDTVFIKIEPPTPR